MSFQSRSKFRSPDNAKERWRQFPREYQDQQRIYSKTTSMKTTTCQCRKEPRGKFLLIFTSTLDVNISSDKKLNGFI